MRYFSRAEAQQKLEARVQTKVSLHRAPIGTKGTVVQIDDRYGGPEDYGVIVRWDLASDPATGQHAEAWFSFDSYLSHLSELTSEGVPDPAHERAAQQRAAKGSAKEFDRAYYHRLVGTVVQGAALIGLVVGGIGGLVLGWKHGGEPIGYLVLGGGGMVVGGFLGKHVMALLAHRLMRLILTRYRQSFRRKYGENI